MMVFVCCAVPPTADVIKWLAWTFFTSPLRSTPRSRYISPTSLATSVLPVPGLPEKTRW